jgi:hypothetical protein
MVGRWSDRNMSRMGSPILLCVDRYCWNLQRLLSNTSNSNTSNLVNRQTKNGSECDFSGFDHAWDQSWTRLGIEVNWDLCRPKGMSYSMR